MKLSIVVPVFNEARKITHDLELLESYLKNQPLPHEVIVVDDGSTDGTHQRVLEFTRTRPAFRGIRYVQNRGKGNAVKVGMQLATGDVVMFVDAGSCVPYSCIERGLAVLQSGYDVALGSRAIAGSKILVESPLYRRIGSRIFGFFARRLIDLRPVRDTQCGFKMFRATAAERLFRIQLISGFMFDIELIANAKRLGYRTIEFPVEWTNDFDTRFNPVRGGSIKVMRDLARIRWYQLTGQYDYSKPRESVGAPAGRVEA